MPQPDGGANARRHIGAAAQRVGVPKPNRNARIRRPLRHRHILARLPGLLLHPVTDHRPLAIDDRPQSRPVIDSIDDARCRPIVADEREHGAGVKRGRRQRFGDPLAQPDQPVGAADADHAATAEHDSAVAGCHAGLLAERVTVVPGQAAVGAARNQHDAHVS